MNLLHRIWAHLRWMWIVFTHEGSAPQHPLDRGTL